MMIPPASVLPRSPKPSSKRYNSEPAPNSYNAFTPIRKHRSSKDSEAQSEKPVYVTTLIELSQLLFRSDVSKISRHCDDWSCRVML